MAFLIFTIVVLLSTCVTEGTIEKHNGIIKSFQRDVQVENAFLEQMTREQPDYLEDRFADKFKRFLIQAVARKGYELRYVIDSTWENIDKTTKCYVCSGSYTFYEIWFDLENPEMENEVEVFLRTESLIGWSMIPAPDKVFPKVSVFLASPPVEPEQGGAIVQPYGYCEDEEDGLDEDQDYDQEYNESDKEEDSESQSTYV